MPDKIETTLKADILKLEKNEKTDSELIKLMVKNPGLILRPIVILKNKALVGKIDIKNIKN